MTSTSPTIRDSAVSTPTGIAATAGFEIRATWLLLPLANYLAWAVFAIVWWLGGIGLGTISLGDLGVVYLDITGLLGLIGIFAMATSLGSSFVLYAIMNRASMHSTRSQFLLSRTIGALGNRVGSQLSPAQFALNSAEVNMQYFANTGRERSSFFWAVLAMIPFAGWIFVITGQWLLSRDFTAHARLESVVLDDVDRTMRTVGLQGFQPSNVRIHPRGGLALTAIIACFLELLSALVLGLDAALILIYLTIGIVSLVWIDLSSHDPLEHFRYHTAVENEIVHSLDNTLGQDGRTV